MMKLELDKLPLATFSFQILLWAKGNRWIIDQMDRQRHPVLKYTIKLYYFFH